MGARPFLSHGWDFQIIGIVGCFLRISSLAAGSHIRQIGQCGHNVSKQKAANSESPHSTNTLSILDAVKLIGSSGLELSAVLQQFANQTASLTLADYSYLALVHESGEFLETVAASNDSLNLKAVHHMPGEGIGGEAWRSGSTVCTTDYKNHPNRISSLSQARQACGVPMIIDGNVIGVLGIMYESMDIDIRDQIELLEEYSNLAAVAINNARIHESTSADLERTKALSEFSNLIHSATGFHHLLNRICETLIAVFNAQRVSFYKLNQTGLLEHLTALESKDGQIISGDRLGGGMAKTSVGSWCINNNETAFVPRGFDDPRDSPEIHNMRRQWNLGATVCVPLINEGGSWGVLLAHRHSKQIDFSENEINLIKIIGNQASTAIHRHELTEKIQHQAYHDELTGLPNRRRFREMLSQHLVAASKTADSVALLFIDLDGFKSINDTLGHAVGDKLLCIVAQRFSKCIDTSDVLARMGGDEFALLISHSTDKGKAIDTCHRILSSLSDKMIINKLEVNVGASIGISYYPENADNAADLLKTSDIAMYHAKSTGKSGVTTFNPQHAKRFEERISLEIDLKDAIKLQQFELYFQPKFSVKNGKVKGVEALLRWQHPTRGFVPPFQFIPVAEESGMVMQLGGWVLDEACRWAQIYQQQGIDISMAVNISAPQFADEGFVSLVINTLEKYSLAPSKLELEVTESIIMKNVTDVVERLSMLRDRGIRIAIDDFGTGYSSLQYLEELPLDVLKIDKAFVDRLDSNSDGKFKSRINQQNNSLVKIIVAMAEAFNLETVVEGVATTEQLEQVVSLGCDLIQGYLYSPPVPADTLPNVIKDIESVNGVLKRTG